MTSSLTVGDVLHSGDASATVLAPLPHVHGRALRIAVTGGIGSGKSTLSRALADEGAVVVDADQLARDVVEPGTPGLAAVVDTFGTGVLHADGTINRPALGALVFNDPDARRTLESILHPLIAAEAAARLDAVPPGGLAVYDVPLLVETEAAHLHDVVVTVTAPEDARLARLEARGLTREEAVRRIRSQVGDEARRRVSTLWVDNAGTPDDLTALTRRLAVLLRAAACTTMHTHQ